MGQTPGGTLTLIDAATGAGSAVPVPDPDRSPFLNQIEPSARPSCPAAPSPFPPSATCACSP